MTLYQSDDKTEQIVKSVLHQELDHLIIELFDEGKRYGYIKPELADETILTYCEVMRRGILSSTRLADVKQESETMHELIGIFAHGMAEKKEQEAAGFIP